MLIRISLIVAILAGLAVGVLNFFTVKEKVVALATERTQERDMKVQAQTELASTRKTLETTTAKLNTTEQNLKDTTAAKEQALTDLAAQTKKADRLTEDLAKTRTERDTAQQNLAQYTFIGLTPQEIIAIRARYSELQTNLASIQGENKLLNQKIVRLTNELAIYKTPEYVVSLPAGLRGKVVVMDPKWNFVVLNIGEDQGVLEHGELLINRDGKLVAKVRVRSVEKNRSIANVVPGWQLGDVMEGDQAIPAHPSSS